MPSRSGILFFSLLGVNLSAGCERKRENNRDGDVGRISEAQSAYLGDDGAIRFAIASYGLASDDLREIESAAAKITAQGARTPEKLEQMTGR
jgi:hypothetical protein